MKKTLIDIGNGVVLSDAIAAVLHQVAVPDAKGAVVILKNGGHLPVERDYELIFDDLTEALTVPPLSDYVPDIAQAMRALQSEHESGKVEVTPPKAASKKDTVASGKEKS